MTSLRGQPAGRYNHRMPRLTIECGPYAGESYVVGDESVIGRLESNVVPIPDDDEASRKHAIIRFRDDRFYVHDLGSKNGTRLNGRRITKAVLTPGDRIVVGSSVFLFVDGETEATLETSENEAVHSGSGIDSSPGGAASPVSDRGRRQQRGGAERGANRAVERANRRVFEMVLFTFLLALTFANASFLTQIVLRLADR